MNAGTFSPAILRRELAVLRIKHVNLARALTIHPSNVADWLSAVRRPNDEMIRRIFCVFAVVREVSIANDGNFAFTRIHIRLLRQRIRQMERSTVKSSRPKAEEDSDAAVVPCPPVN